MPHCFRLTHRTMKTTVTRILSLIVSTSAAVLVSGCGPRGESHTIDQIFTDSRANYTETSAQVAPDVGTSLTNLTSSLDKIAGQGGGGDARQISASLAEGLTALLPKAGFTQRAAITELINQYRSLASATGAPLTLGAANLKLIAARTYSILSAELMSTKFRIAYCGSEASRKRRGPRAPFFMAGLSRHAERFQFPQ